MSSPAFRGPDFKVFDVKGFQPRMTEIRSRLRPKLEAFGTSLAPQIARTVGAEVFAHVAKHARRTVNPPDDTWVAFGPEARGYTAAAEAVRVQQERYRLGAGTLLDLLTAQANLTQAEVSRVQARYTYLIARAQLEALVGHAL